MWRGKSCNPHSTESEAISFDVSGKPPPNPAAQTPANHAATMRQPRGTHAIHTVDVHFAHSTVGGPVQCRRTAVEEVGAAPPRPPQAPATAPLPQGAEDARLGEVRQRTSTPGLHRPMDRATNCRDHPQTLLESQEGRVEATMITTACPLCLGKIYGRQTLDGCLAALCCQACPSATPGVLQPTGGRPVIVSTSCDSPSKGPRRPPSLQRKAAPPRGTRPSPIGSVAQIARQADPAQCFSSLFGVHHCRHKERTCLKNVVTLWCSLITV